MKWKKISTETGYVCYSTLTQTNEMLLRALSKFTLNVSLKRVVNKGSDYIDYIDYIDYTDYMDYIDYIDYSDYIVLILL